MNKKLITMIGVYLAIFAYRTHGMNCSRHDDQWDKTKSLEYNQMSLVNSMMVNCIHTITGNSYKTSFKRVLSTISQNIYGCELMRRIISVYHNEPNTTKCSFFSHPIHSEEVTTTINVDGNDESETLAHAYIINLQYQSVSFHVLQKNNLQLEQICISFSAKSSDNIWTDDVILFTSMVHWLHYITDPKLTIDMCDTSVDVLLKSNTQDFIESIKHKCCILALGNAEKCLATTGYNVHPYAERYNFINTNEYLLSKKCDISTMITPHAIGKVTLSIGGNIKEIKDNYSIEHYVVIKKPKCKNLAFGKCYYQHSRQSFWNKVCKTFSCKNLRPPQKQRCEISQSEDM